MAEKALDDGQLRCARPGGRPRGQRPRHSRERQDHVVPSTPDAIAFRRAPHEVLHIVYLTDKQGVSKGGFYLSSMNGALKRTRALSRGANLRDETTVNAWGVCPISSMAPPRSPMSPGPLRSFCAAGRIAAVRGRKVHHRSMKASGDSQQDIQRLVCPLPQAEGIRYRSSRSPLKNGWRTFPPRISQGTRFSASSVHQRDRCARGWAR